MHPLRFGVNCGGDPDGWPEFCRWAERTGFDTLLVPDHLGSPAPFAMLATAAAVTERVRLGTYVVNAAFWNPAMLARELATVDRLSGGRLETGLGSGHMKSEFDAAGIPWQGFDARADWLDTTIRELDRLFADDGQQPLPNQRPRPPLLIGGTGDRLLRLAAEHADIMAYAAVFQVKGAPPGTFRVAGPAELDERVAFFRDQAGDRADQMEAGLLVQRVEITDDRERRIAELKAEHDLPNPLADLMTCPALMFGTIEELAEQLHATTKRYGITYFVSHRRSVDDFAELVRHLRPAGEHTGKAP